MEMTTIELRKLTASNGKVLTNGEVFSKEIYLGCNDSADNWYEITDEEYAIILTEQEKELLDDIEEITE